MSKYEPLWNWVIENGTESLRLTFEDVENIIGFPIDHSFLNCKKELTSYKYEVGKISMKEKNVLFKRI